jgi:hypothetical protein
MRISPRAELKNLHTVERLNKKLNCTRIFKEIKEGTQLLPKPTAPVAKGRENIH